jgi:hypothetical protein
MRKSQLKSSRISEKSQCPPPESFTLLGNGFRYLISDKDGLLTLHFITPNGERGNIKVDSKGRTVNVIRGDVVNLIIGNQTDVIVGDKITAVRGKVVSLSGNYQAICGKQVHLNPKELSNKDLRTLPASLSVRKGRKRLSQCLCHSQSSGPTRT